jgi:DNA topoisomerase-2
MPPKEKDLDEKYKKHELRSHIYSLPDTYIGSIEPAVIETYAYNDTDRRMEKKELMVIQGLYKIYDEILVNAIDQSMRLKAEIENGRKDIKPLKTIRISIDKQTGYIEVMNDGDGIDVETHPSYNVLIPELIFGELLTSTNYNTEEERLWGGRNGYGSKLTNIFSKEFIVETVDHRRSKMYQQRFYDNMKMREKAKVKASTKLPYTKIRFLPDYERFGLKGMTDDMYRLFRKRAFDVCATTDPTVSVYFNDQKLEVKDFEKYADLYLGSKEEHPRVHEACGDGRWEVVASYNESGQFEQVSFVNGINTLRGGKHVDQVVLQITKRLAEMVSGKKKKEIKPQYIRDNLIVFVKALIVNPSFDSQTKETLTTQASKFGSKCDLSDKFYDKLYKTGLADKALSLTEFHENKQLKKTDGKKTSRVLIPNLDDANRAGTKDSAKCTLILTEGLSAKTMAISGLSVVGRDYYGVFPLRGKILNVKDAAVAKITANEEITNLKKILGLEQGKEYKDLSSLRYGKIMALCDSDVDGSHIKGLLFNVFQSLWPSLYKTDGFLVSMLTPIVKAIHGTTKETISFYNLTDYENWRERKEREPSGLRNWRFKYYKGLGTSTDTEAKEYFKEMQEVHYKYQGKPSDESIDLAFNKKRADDRKSWLMRYNRQNILDYTRRDIPYEDFVNKELIHFSNRDLERSIPSLCDGLKESTRKILFGCFKRKLYTNEIRVAQLSGYVSEVSAYHHGEASLQQAIIGMAQQFVGANNINLLQPNGQFGSRLLGGSDAASPRYIHTLLSPLARVIYREEDNAILDYLDDDGIPVEPEYYIPIIPMILVNGGIGIGTGFSTNIPNHNPSDIVDMCKAIISTLEKSTDAIDTKEQLETAVRAMSKTKLPRAHPWYLGFKGRIEDYKDGSYQSRGIWSWIDDQTVEITELPIGVWTDDYKEFLVQMITNGSPYLKDFSSHYTPNKVRFVLYLYPGVRAKLASIIETEFKLVSTKNLSMNNIHLYSADGAIRRFKTPQEIVLEWAAVRLEKYYDRKRHQLRSMEADYKVLGAKVRFIQDIIDKRVNVMNQKQKDVDEQLSALGYPKLSETMVAEQQAVAEEGAGPSTVPAKAKDADYNYLTRMPIHQLTYEKKVALEKEADALKVMIRDLKATPIYTIWARELDEFAKAWDTFRRGMEEHYDLEEEGASATPTKKRRATAAPKKK